MILDENLSVDSLLQGSDNDTLNFTQKKKLV